MKKIFLFLFMLLFLPQICLAEVEFTNGFWEEDFDDCASDQDITAGGALPTCASDISNGTGTSGCTSQSHDPSQILSSADRSGGGRGFQRWWGEWYGGNNYHYTSPYPIFNFPSGTNEIWIRWYSKFIGQVDSQGKDNYVFTDEDSTPPCAPVLHLDSDPWSMVDYYCDLTAPDCTTNCDTFVDLKDGSWHQVEVHYKLDTTAKTFFLEIWIDNVYKGSGGPTGTLESSITGIDHLYFNQSTRDSSSDNCANNRGLQHDDIAIATLDYTGFDDCDDGAGGTTKSCIGAYAGSSPSLPTLSSAVISTNGTTLILTFSEGVTQGTGYNDSDWDIDSVEQGQLSLTYFSGDGTSSHVYTINQKIYKTDTVDIDFNGDTDSEEDASGDDLAAIVSDSVTNNSTQVVPAISGGSIGMIR